MTPKRDRVLLVVTPSVTDVQLADEVPASHLSGSEVRVVVPAVAKSALSFWFSDEGGVEQARSAAAKIGSSIAATASRVESTAGDSDPVLAVEDAIATFHPDRIIVVHRSDHPGFREKRLDHDSLTHRLNREVEDHLVAA
jgi:hypothetical protein